MRAREGNRTAAKAAIYYRAVKHPSMDRRTFLVGAALSLGGCASTLDSLSVGVITDWEWRNNQEILSITLSENHDADRLAITREEDAETSIWWDETPPGSGPVEIPLMKVVRCDQREYTTSTFRVIPFRTGDDAAAIEELQVTVSEAWFERVEAYEFDSEATAERECSQYPRETEIPDLVGEG